VFGCVGMHRVDGHEEAISLVGCHETCSKCRQHAPGQRLKAKLKAVMLSLATGLSWSASCLGIHHAQCPPTLLWRLEFDVTSAFQGLQCEASGGGGKCLLC